MRQNKTGSTSVGKFIITAISIIGLFLVNQSFGNNADF